MATHDTNLKSFVAQFWKLGADEVHDGLKFTSASLKGMSSTRFLVFVTAVETNFNVRLNDPAAITDFETLRRLVAGGPSAEPAMKRVVATAPLRSPSTTPPVSVATRTVVARAEPSLFENLGLGHDIEDVRNLPEATDYTTASFYTKTFTATEIAYCANMAAPRQHFAARIAAKEALYKTSPLLRDLKHNEIEVLNGESGRPQMRILSDSVNRTLGAHVFLVSLSHTDSLASATVLLIRTS